MNMQATFADSVRPIKMSLIWIAAFVVVVLVLGVLDPLQTVAYLVENQGLGEEGASVLGMVAGYTFPLTLGFAVIMFYAISGRTSALSAPQKLAGAAIVLFVSGLLANGLGFGLPPSYGRMISGPFYIAFPLFVAVGYLTTYGFALSLCAFTIGSAAALHFERLLQGSTE